MRDNKYFYSAFIRNGDIYLAKVHSSQVWRWTFSKDVLYKDGNIYWRTISPAGMLIKYKDGTKRFISEDYWL